MAKRKNVKRKPKIVKVKLPKAGVLRVVAPPGVVPAFQNYVAEKRAVEIVPVKPFSRKAQKWWERLLYGPV